MCADRGLLLNVSDGFGKLDIQSVKVSTVSCFFLLSGICRKLLLSKKIINVKFFTNTFVSR